jgi:putative ABC transport system permease protein
MLAMYTTITERTREIGILKAMGASRGYIVGIIEKEAILISLIGLVVGFVISSIAGFFIHEVYGLVFEYSWQWALTAAAIGLLGWNSRRSLSLPGELRTFDPVNALAYDLIITEQGAKRPVVCAPNISSMTGRYAPGSASRCSKSLCTRFW